MNNQEVIMHSPLQPTGLIAHRKALEAAGIAISLVMRLEVVSPGYDGGRRSRNQRGQRPPRHY